MRRNRRKQRMELRRPHTLVSASPKFKAHHKTHLLCSKSTENLGELEEKEARVCGWCTGQGGGNGGQGDGDGCVREGEKVFRSGLEKNKEEEREGKRRERKRKGTHAPDMSFSDGFMC
ncbi:hypothetical protein FNV43_RR12887 [Rhamnella rubrinervis]|uniref:Uncharacterized protein n=1 Tax=Rhamnella rubrinervis TaxID=2594499 RepID=A0A8K0H010_9ROSA|nr:hypothetical protein FNV43_RR12887 [Rhamnella rubrinervis]